MIDTETCVAAERIPEIFPESVDPLTWIQGPQRVSPALRDKAAIGLPHLRAKQCVIDPSFRRINVEIGRHDIEVAGEHDRLAGREEFLGMLGQTLKPAQLVIE